MQITFLGAAGTVTGSKYLLSIENKKILIDCGLFQGLKELRLRNWDPLPIESQSIDAVLLTHAHLDHSGYIPLLVKNGFSNEIYCTQGTKDLCEILLPDSGFLQEEEAYYANKHAYSKHKPALPLYTLEDARFALKFFTAVPFNKKFLLFKNIHIEFFHAGHIIGAAMIKITYQNQSILFSGDLGRPHDAVMQSPAIVDAMDYLVIESTYGDRLHDTQHPKDFLKDFILKTINRHGTIIIPAFAVGRAQALLHFIAQLKNENAIPKQLPVYLDSPMAIDSTHILLHHRNEIRLSKKECQELNTMTHFTNTQDESKALDADVKTPKIIISASGMATGGRVLHHLKTYAPDARNTILFTGYQATETRGERILRGESQIKLLGEIVPIRAEIASITNLSAHADYSETLTWMQHIKHPPKHVFVTHGNPKAAMHLSDKIHEKFTWKTSVPHYRQTETL